MEDSGLNQHLCVSRWQGYVRASIHHFCEWPGSSVCRAVSNLVTNGCPSWDTCCPWCQDDFRMAVISINLMMECKRQTMAMIVAQRPTKPWHCASPCKLQSPCPRRNARKQWPACGPKTRQLLWLPWAWVHRCQCWMTTTTPPMRCTAHSIPWPLRPSWTYQITINSGLYM